ncbi:hypothetical protein BaRGS_00018058 [Batillaria attramentaria]|uniref:Uncharacterized protein n=1 Tax=Batillaria attramentaria TaxID=370345 RepID=A0ABD0KUE5_9CAEN
MFTGFKVRSVFVQDTFLLYCHLLMKLLTALHIKPDRVTTPCPSQTSQPIHKDTAGAEWNKKTSQVYRMHRTLINIWPDANDAVGVGDHSNDRRSDEACPSSE